MTTTLKAWAKKYIIQVITDAGVQAIPAEWANHTQWDIWLAERIVSTDLGIEDQTEYDFLLAYAFDSNCLHTAVALLAQEPFAKHIKPETKFIVLEKLLDQDASLLGDQDALVLNILKKIITLDFMPYMGFSQQHVIQKAWAKKIWGLVLEKWNIKYHMFFLKNVEMGYIVLNASMFFKILLCLFMQHANRLETPGVQGDRFSSEPEKSRLPHILVDMAKRIYPLLDNRQEEKEVDARIQDFLNRIGEIESKPQGGFRDAWANLFAMLTKDSITRSEKSGYPQKSGNSMLNLYFSKTSVSGPTVEEMIRDPDPKNLHLFLQNQSFLSRPNKFEILCLASEHHKLVYFSETLSVLKTVFPEEYENLLVSACEAQHEHMVDVLIQSTDIADIPAIGAHGLYVNSEPVHHDPLDNLYKSLKNILIGDTSVLDSIPLDRVDQYGNTIFHKAAQDKNSSVFLKMLDVFSKERKESFIRVLNMQNKDGQTVLHIVLTKSNPKSLKKLLAYKVDLDIIDHNGHTPEDIAMRNQDREIFNILRNHIARTQKNTAVLPIHTQDTLITSSEGSAGGSEPALSDFNPTALQSVFFHDDIFFEGFPVINQRKKSEPIKNAELAEEKEMESVDNAQLLLQRLQRLPQEQQEIFFGRFIDYKQRQAKKKNEAYENLSDKISRLTTCSFGNYIQIFILLSQIKNSDTRTHFQKMFYEYFKSYIAASQIMSLEETSGTVSAHGARGWWYSTLYEILDEFGLQQSYIEECIQAYRTLLAEKKGASVDLKDNHEITQLLGQDLTNAWNHAVGRAYCPYIPPCSGMQNSKRTFVTAFRDPSPSGASSTYDGSSTHVFQETGDPVYGEVFPPGPKKPKLG